ncbi:MAG: 16S rRNA (guanine(527)-N(7))-methyltransferase RsmG [Vampirovibrio sp.]|nr:16S rRNA (guanine(527)-N(7))-methyltransferase RsmG [Vampirovibrio sp.]
MTDYTNPTPLEPTSELPISDYRDQWLAAIAEFQPDASPEALFDQIVQLHQELVTYNQHTNLTRITDPHGFLFRHVLDSLSLLPWIPTNAKVIDIGSGAGFPAIPLVLARPDIHVTAVESVGKKCRFIDLIRESFQLENRLTVINDRAEIVGRKGSASREQFDVAVSRAVAKIPVLLELSAPMVKVKGRIIAMKGESCQQELSTAQKAITTLSVKLDNVHELTQKALRGSTLAIFSKEKQTLGVYPRNPGTPGKNPL